MNNYETLEVSQNASQEVIKAAYRSLMQRYHPDRNPGDADAAARSVSVAQAYEVLSDPGKRAAYDCELKLRSDSVDSVQVRARHILAAAAADDKASGYRWWLWLLTLLIALVLWSIFSSSEKKQSAGIEPQQIRSLLGNFMSDAQQSPPADPAAPAPARTIPVYLKDVNVNLAASPEFKGGAMVSSTCVLSIKAMGVVAGTFDPDKFISFMENNKEYIGQQLSTRLTGAQCDMLIKQNGEHYLKQLVLDSIGEITGTNRLEEFPSNGTGVPSHYGAVDVLFPYSFTVVAQQPD